METIFFEDAGIKVTNSRFMTHGQTYALGGITSVSRLVEKPKRLIPVLIFFAGLATFGVSNSVFLPLIFIAIAVFIWISQKPKYVVMIRNASGDSRTLVDPNLTRVNKVIAALNDAIVHRG
ncbi:DUF6232 family protein [Deinococcus ruber]|uniref:QacE n=1 Tax=Deinococcus ruber TaxID=1848197 RepID=A0A918CA69_9DEIO|nr:DUF6232 family protein [Deinococcus ruber]GGR12205.1 hypothetical protein GCM10008957_26330 [Deinococcus ruber]